MGTKPAVRVLPDPSSSVAEALFGSVQRRVLGMLFGNPSRSFYANEIITAAKSGTGAVQRELAKLVAAGLATSIRVGNQRHYRANPETPVFAELRALMLKTSGLADTLRAALAASEPDILAGFVFGSVAKGQDNASSDVDVMILSDTIAYSDLYASLEDTSRILGRQINPTVYSAAEFARRVRSRNAFVVRVMDQPKIWLIGGPRDLPA